MTTRKLTIKGFITKATKAASAEGFLTQYREYLTTGEVADITSPILHKVDIGYMAPKIGLEEITNAVYAHMMVVEMQKAEANSKKVEPITKPVIANIVSVSGEMINSESFKLHQDAERWVDNRLYDGHPGSHGEVIHTQLLIKGSPQTTLITREDAIARILRKPKPMAMKRVGSHSGKLGFVGRARNSQAHFSRG